MALGPVTLDAERAGFDFVVHAHVLYDGCGYAL
jgi:hypothetical protein